MIRLGFDEGLSTGFVFLVLPKGNISTATTFLFPVTILGEVFLRMVGLLGAVDDLAGVVLFLVRIITY